MYGYVHAYKRRCMHVCMNVYESEYVYGCGQVCMYVSAAMRMCEVHVCVCVYVTCMCMDTYVYIYTCVYVYVRVYL